MSIRSTSDVATQTVAVLQTGQPIDWTDLRVSIVVLLALGIGGLFGAYLRAYFSKRGELAGIRKDLEQITHIQEQIKSSISKQQWIDQNFWSLKRETYWKLTAALSRLSSSLHELCSQGYLPDKQTINHDVAIVGPLVRRVEEGLDELIELTAPAKIVLSNTAIDVLELLHIECGTHHSTARDPMQSYNAFSGLRGSVDRAFNAFIQAARIDLNSEFDEN